MKRVKKTKYQKLRSRKERRSNIINLSIRFLSWIGAAVLYYVVFSIFFDTPLESSLRRSSDKLEEEYNLLSARFDSLEMVLANVEERDKSIFRTMFESDPYDFESEFNKQRLSYYEEILSMSNQKLNDILDTRVNSLEENLTTLSQASSRMLENAERRIGDVENIPSIQPIANKQLTLLTASYGMRMHPFYKTLKSHQGVDYTVPEGTRVFATADGVVKSVTVNSTSGKSVTLDHGNGYTTTYSHLGATSTWRGQRVKRGDIIALSGNTGLSLTPHLHYEVSYNGMRVDPIHYFFMELSPMEYQRMIKIAQSGMQSFD